MPQPSGGGGGDQTATRCRVAVAAALLAAFMLATPVALLVYISSPTQIAFDGTRSAAALRQLHTGHRSTANRDVAGLDADCTGRCDALGGMCFFGACFCRPGVAGEFCTERAHPSQALAACVGKVSVACYRSRSGRLIVPVQWQRAVLQKQPPAMAQDSLIQFFQRLIWVSPQPLHLGRVAELYGGAIPLTRVFQHEGSVPLTSLFHCDPNAAAALGAPLTPDVPLTIMPAAPELLANRLDMYRGHFDTVVLNGALDRASNAFVLLRVTHALLRDGGTLIMRAKMYTGTETTATAESHVTLRPGRSFLKHFVSLFHALREEEEDYGDNNRQQLFFVGTKRTFSQQFTNSLSQRQRRPTLPLPFYLAGGEIQGGLVARPTRVLITVATAHGRRWITLLAFLSIVNAMEELVAISGVSATLLVALVGGEIDPSIREVLDGEGQFSFEVRFVAVATPGGNGFVASRERLVDAFLTLDGKSYSHWLHLDDDMLIGSGMGKAKNAFGRALFEYSTYRPGGGILALFLNSWATPAKKQEFTSHGPLVECEYFGAPAFIIDRTSLEQAGGGENLNPYTHCRRVDPKGCEDGEAANREFWKLLKSNGMALLSNMYDPYPVQHLANTRSLIFGKKPGWFGLFAWDRNFAAAAAPGAFVAVPPFQTDDILRITQPPPKDETTRPHAKMGLSMVLVRYVLEMNAVMPHCRLPLETAMALRQDIADAVLSWHSEGQRSESQRFGPGLSALLWAAFNATGCPYRTENTGFWSRKIIAKGIDAAGPAVWNDMVQFCRLVRKGTATAKQRERCCGGRGGSRSSLPAQEDLCTAEFVQRMKCVRLQRWPVLTAQTKR